MRNPHLGRLIMIGTAAALLGSAAIGAGASLFAGSQQSKAAAAALAQQKQMYDQARSDSAPFMNVGKGALISLGQLYGIDKDGNATGKPFDPSAISAFENSPDYKFAFDQGMKGLTFSNAAKGLLKSGGNLKDIVQFGQGQATQNFQNYANRLLQLSQIGAGTASSNMQAALTAGGQNSAMINQQGAANASGVVGAANAASGALGTYGNQLYLQNLMTSMRGTGAPGAGASFPVGGSNPVPYAGTSGPGMGLPGFADGGITPGGPIVVGEEGPEVITPPAGSRVIPNELARASLPMYMDETRGAYPVGTGQDAVAPRNRMDAAYDTSKSRWSAVADYMRKALIGDPEAKIQVPVDQDGVPMDMNLPGSAYKEIYGQDHPAGESAVNLGMMATPAVAAAPIKTGLSIASELMGMAPKTTMAAGGTALAGGAGIASITDTASDAAEKVRPSAQQTVLVEGLKARMDRNDEAIKKLREQMATNDSQITNLGTQMTKSPKGTQENAQKALTSSNASAQTQLDKLSAEQADLQERHGKASDALTEMLNSEHNEDRDAAAAGQSTVDKMPWTKALPYAGGAAALALSWGNRYRAIATHNEYVDRIAEATKKAENAIKKNAFSPVSAKRVDELRNLERGYETVQSETRTALGPLLGAATAGGLVATELGMAPWQIDRTMAEGTAGRTKAEAMTDFTNPEMWKNAGWSALPGVTGASVGAEVANFLHGKHLADLERASATISNYQDIHDMGPKEYRQRSQGGDKVKMITSRPALKLIGR